VDDEALVKDAEGFRTYLDEVIAKTPEPFPAEIKEGKRLFPSVTLMLCFLHGVVGIQQAIGRKCSAFVL